MFNHFSLAKQKRVKTEEPKNYITWLKLSISEFIGTIILALSLVGLSTVVPGTKHTLEAFMIHPILVGFYAGFIFVGFVFLFSLDDLVT